MKFETAQIHFLGDIFAAVAILLPQYYTFHVILDLRILGWPVIDSLGAGCLLANLSKDIFEQRPSTRHFASLGDVLAQIFGHIVSITVMKK